jgi:hypothetical protein
LRYDDSGQGDDDTGGDRRHTIHEHLPRRTSVWPTGHDPKREARSGVHFTRQNVVPFAGPIFSGLLEGRFGFQCEIALVGESA